MKRELILTAVDCLGINQIIAEKHPLRDPKIFDRSMKLPILSAR